MQRTSLVQIVQQNVFQTADPFVMRVAIEFVDLVDLGLAVNYVFRMTNVAQMESVWRESTHSLVSAMLVSLEQTA